MRWPLGSAIALLVVALAACGSSRMARTGMDRTPPASEAGHDAEKGDHYGHIPVGPENDASAPLPATNDAAASDADAGGFDASAPPSTPYVGARVSMLFGGALDWLAPQGGFGLIGFSFGEGNPPNVVFDELGPPGWVAMARTLDLLVTKYATASMVRVAIASVSQRSVIATVDIGPFAQDAAEYPGTVCTTSQKAYVSYGEPDVAVVDLSRHVVTGTFDVPGFEGLQSPGLRDCFQIGGRVYFPIGDVLVVDAASDQVLSTVPMGQFNLCGWLPVGDGTGYGIVRSGGGQSCTGSKVELLDVVQGVSLGPIASLPYEGSWQLLMVGDALVACGSGDPNLLVRIDPVTRQVTLAAGLPFLCNDLKPVAPPWVAHSFGDGTYRLVNIMTAETSPLLTLGTSPPRSPRPLVFLE